MKMKVRYRIVKGKIVCLEKGKDYRVGILIETKIHCLQDRPGDEFNYVPALHRNLSPLAKEFARRGAKIHGPAGVRIRQTLDATTIYFPWWSNEPERKVFQDNEGINKASLGDPIYDKDASEEVASLKSKFPGWDKMY